MTGDDFPMIGPPSVEECLFWMPSIAKRAASEWARGFAASVLRQSKRRNWKPTPKQLGMMRSLVAEMFNYGGGEEAVLIE